MHFYFYYSLIVLILPLSFNYRISYLIHTHLGTKCAAVLLRNYSLIHSFAKQEIRSVERGIRPIAVLYVAFNLLSFNI